MEDFIRYIPHTEEDIRKMLETVGVKKGEDLFEIIPKECRLSKPLNLPNLAFSLGPVCEYIVNYFDEEIYPGDVISHNDVFFMGNQNNDVAV